jgi:hypothetical protein
VFQISRNIYHTRDLLPVNGINLRIAPMISLLKVVAVYRAVRYVHELCREAEQYQVQPKVTVAPTVVDVVVPPVVDDGIEPEPQQGNTPDVNLIGTGECAGSIPGHDEPGFIPDAVEGVPLRKSAGRIGVDEDCSTGSPALEQRGIKKKPRSPKKRARLRQEIPRFVSVEPTLISVEIR